VKVDLPGAGSHVHHGACRLKVKEQENLPELTSTSLKEDPKERTSK